MYLGFDLLGSMIKDAKAKSTHELGNTTYIGGNAFGGIASLGYNINKIIDFDISLQYSYENSLKEAIRGVEFKQTFDIFAPMARLFYNHYITDNVKLYLGGGFGFSRVFMNSSILKDKQILHKTKIHDLNLPKLDPKTSIALGVYAGISKMVNNISFELGYSFGYFGKTCEENNKLEAIPLDIYINSVRTGIKFHF
jgi:opacity protein-like surface antigen